MKRFNFGGLYWLPVALVAGISLAALAVTPKSAEKGALARNLDIFTAVYKELNSNYVDSFDAEKGINTAISAMLDNIDPYTEFYPASDQDELTMMTSGSYGGMGSLIMEPKRGKGVYISEPYEGSPSALAGLRPGDLVVAIDGDTMLTESSETVSAKLKGDPGSTFRLTVKRPYTTGDSILTFDITRQKIVMPSVPYYGVLGDSIGYIYLTQFTDKAAESVRKAMEEFKNDRRVRYIVLDLRGNHGGLLEAAVEIVGMFVPKGTEVLRTRGRGVMDERIYKTVQAPIDTKIPLFVLTDGQTASSAEIVAGALQDMDRAVIVGNRSFGKGLVQTTRPLPYEGILKVTTAKYYIPSGRLIQAIDYSRRNADGTVARTPDSLTNVYYTKAGREVRDGGGITPDVNVTYGDMNRLTYNVVRDNWAFDYATRYRARHDSIVPAEEFTVTDSMFEEFKASIDPDKFSYDKVCEQMLAKLKSAAETEGYMNDSVRMEFERMESLLKHDLNHDLDNNRSDLETILAQEILKRYYYQRGPIIASLRNDPALDSIRTILSATGRYNEILKPKH